MKLISLKLRNFKGIREFELRPDGNDLAVFGDNAAGKTTLVDAWMWLMFGKDSHNRADFELKTLDESGQPIHGLEHEVEATLRLPDSQELTLRKVYKEVWAKRRGSAERTMSGHTTDHYLDGVPVKKSEYDAAIKEIADEDTFRLLTDPTYFNVHMHWQDRRALLLEVCGDVTDADVITSDQALAELPSILKGRSLDDHRKVIAARRREINEELEKIPVRIDEATRGLPELPEADRETLETRLAGLRAKRQELEQAKVRATSGGAVAEKEAQIADLALQQARVRQRVEQAYHNAIQADREGLAQVEADVAGARSRLRVLEREQEADQREMARLEARIEQLRARWHDINGREFDGPPPADVEEACPACEQPLPAERVEAARQKAQAEYEERLAAFNEQKARDLEQINAEGKALREQMGALRAACDKRAEAIREAAIEVGKLESRAAELRQRIEQVLAPDPSSDPEYAALQSQIDSLREAITALKADAFVALAVVDNDIRALDEQIREAEAALGRIEQHQRGLARIEELTAEERRLAAEFEQLEKELHLTEQFIRAKVRLLEERINSRFRLARFKLFRELVNGGLEEACETTFDGVPYGSLNHGARLNVGLDIINTLADHFGFAPPVFIDNAESVTSILPTAGQQIKLVVSAADKTLRVEQATPVKEAV